MNLIVFIAAGALALNNTLPDVHLTRNKLYGAGLPQSGFDCRAGVQARYSDLLGQTLYGYDIENQEYIGSFLIVDVASQDHAGTMELSGIALDTDCQELVHSVGLFFLLNEKEYRHPDAIIYRYSSATIPRVRNRLRSSHALCGADTPCHWRVENWVWE